MLSVTDTRHVQRRDCQLRNLGPPGSEDGNGHAGEGIRQEARLEAADSALRPGLALSAFNLPEVAERP